MREPDDDGERVAVFCNTLGGAFIFSREEAERRIIKYFPEVAFEDVARAARHLENNMRIFLQPFQQASRRHTSWVHGWRD